MWVNWCLEMLSSYFKVISLVSDGINMRCYLVSFKVSDFDGYVCIVLK